MERPSGRCFFRKALAVLAAALLAGELQAADWPAFRVAGTGGGKRPFVLFDGGEMLAPGQTSSRGVEVVSVSSGSVVLRWEGEERTFRVSEASPSGAGAESGRPRNRSGAAQAAEARKAFALPRVPGEFLRRTGETAGRIAVGLLVLCGVVSLFLFSRRRSGMSPVSAPRPPRRRRASRWFAEPSDEGFEEHRGRVVAVLPEDTIGIRHQRILVRTERRAKVLLVHNIDLCPRIEGLEAGREIRFYGQFAPNDRGGVFHRLHRNTNPFRPRVDGWIEYGDHRYS